MGNGAGAGSVASIDLYYTIASIFPDVPIKTPRRGNLWVTHGPTVGIESGIGEAFCRSSRPSVAVHLTRCALPDLHIRGRRPEEADQQAAFGEKDRSAGRG